MSNPEQVALLFAGSFERRELSNRTISTRTEFAPEWVEEICYKAHDDLMPDDWRYWMIHRLAEAISEYVEQHGDWPDPDELNDIVDTAMPVYYGEQADWLASNGIRATYCDEAEDEGRIPDDASIMDRIAAGFYYEFEHVAYIVVNELKKVDLDA